MKNFDIIIIGAGPGGSFAGKAAAENGYSSCIVEKEALGKAGRYKACGGAIAWELVDEIDYPEEKISRVIESLELHHIDGETYSKKGKGGVVWRSTFDKYLTDMAIESGTLLKEKEPMVKVERKNGLYEITTTKDKYSAKYVIAADGVNSLTLKQLNWPYFASDNVILTITEERKTPLAEGR